MIVVLAIATVVFVVITLLPGWRHPHWLVRGMDFPRVQLAVLATLLLLLLLTQLEWTEPTPLVLIAVTSLCLLWHVWRIAPYTRIWPREVLDASDPSPANRISILTANVLTSNRNADALIALVRKLAPDVLATLESDRWWQDRLDALEGEMPYSLKCPLDNLYGLHVYSRLPLEQPEISYLVEDDKPSAHTLVRLRTGDAVRLHVMHPAPPSPTENPESAERDAELVVLGRSVATSRHPVIVTGDLNDVAWSATTRLFRRLSGLLDPRVGRGMFNTFHVGYPFFRFPLDHVFHSKHFTLVSLRRLPSIGSDHFPLFAELSYAPVRGAGQEGPAADAADRSWARSIAREQGVSASEVPSPGE